MCSRVGVWGFCTPGQPLQELALGLEHLRGEGLESTPAEAIGDDLIALRRHINSCKAEFTRRLARFDRGQGYAVSGALTSKSWLRWQCHLTGAAASDRVEVSRRMDALPQAVQAFASGDISYQHAAMIVRTADELGDKMESQAESILVEAAKELDPARLRFVTIHLRHCLQPEGVLSDAQDVHQRRFMHLSQTFDGIFRIDGQLDGDGGATLQTALNSLIGPPAADDERTATQRRADALVEMARRQLDGGELPKVSGQKPHLMVTVDMPTLTKQRGSPAAELEWSQPIPAETARRIACDCVITPVFRGAESHQVDAGATSRVIPPSMRRALIARDKGCRFPGCDRPPAWTDGHHLKHWADGGPTQPYNLALLCGRHHYRVHEEGWRLSWGTKGELVAVPP